MGNILRLKRKLIRNRGIILKDVNVLISHDDISKVHETIGYLSSINGEYANSLIKSLESIANKFNDAFLKELES